MVGEVLPDGYRLGVHPEWRRPCRAREEHMGGVGPDAAFQSARRC